MDTTSPHLVMAGLVPAIHVFGAKRKYDVDARVKPGHDGEIRDTLSPRHCERSEAIHLAACETMDGLLRRKGSSQ